MTEKATTIEFKPPARDDFLEDIRRGRIRPGSHYISADGTVYTIKALRADGGMTLAREYPKARGKAARKAEKRARHTADAATVKRQSMKLPATVKQIRTMFVQQFGIPSGTPETIDEPARQWCIKFAQQIAAALPGQGFGVKRADPGRPIGKDTLAQQSPAGLVCWDLFTGTSTGNPRLNEDPDSESIPDQTFVPVEPHDWLGILNTKPTDPTPVPQPIPPGGTDELTAALRRLEQKVDGIAGLTAHLEDLVKSSDDANERRYADIVANIQHQPAAKGYTGTVSIFGVKVSIELNPKA